MRNANEGVSLTEAILAIRGIDKYASYKTIKTIKTIIITIVLIILALAFFSIHKVIDEIIADKSNNVIMFDPVTGREFLADGCNNVKKVAAPLKDTMKCTEENIT
ncbi:hypothetical protein LJJ48_004548 [Salmonella enterica]|nr:hypothetical protein [Salmonella enterica]